MVQEIKSYQWLSKMVENNQEIVEITKQLDDICRYCDLTTPMVCVERCKIWEAKNEFLEMGEMLCTDDHVQDLLNAVKNDRRQKVIEALHEHPQSIKGLQEYLKRQGYYHSRGTIITEYVGPLVDVGLVKTEGDKYELTVYGRKFKEVLSAFKIEDYLPSHSHCHEEIILRELGDGPKTYADLSGSLVRKSLGRAIKRLTKKGMVSGSNSRDYIFYFRTKKVPKKAFSPTERRVYESISDVGKSARELSEDVGINLRRIYKYLRVLRKKRLVFTRKRPRTYELTSLGRDVANFLEETASLVLDASRASAFLLERSQQTMATPSL